MFAPLAESHRRGGTSVIGGCMPKKPHVCAAHTCEEPNDVSGDGKTVAEARLS